MRDEIGEDLDLREGPTSIVGRLVEDGTVRKRPVKDSRKSLFRALPDRITLGHLMRHAGNCVDSDVEGSVGRDPLGEIRMIWTISPGQFTRMKTAANSLARHLVNAAEHEGLDGDDLWSLVTDGSLWVWDSAALSTPSRGWKRIYDMVERSAPRSRRSADRGALILLLDLCGTHELLPRQERGDRFLIPETWSPVQARWLAVVEEIRWHHFALQEILRVVAEVYGAEYDLRRLAKHQREAERVLGRIRDVMLATSGTMTSTQRTYLRKVLRALMDAGELAQVEIDAYDLRQHDRFKAWSQSYDKVIAHAHVHETRTEQDLAWRDFPFPGLSEPDNPYSLRSAVSWWANSEDRPIEEAAPNMFPRTAPRRGGDGDLWSEPTCRGNLTILAYFVGILQAYAEDVDLQSADLRQILTIENAERVLQAYRDDRITHRMARDILIYMGLLASPYLERMALRAEDMELADRAFELSATVTGYGVPRHEGAAIEFSGRTLRDQLDRIAAGRARTMPDSERDDEGDSDERQRANALLQQRIYEQVLDVEYAFDGMEMIYRAALGAVLDRLGASSAEDINERWEEIQPTKSELVDLRALSLWNDSLSAPMRARAISEQSLEHRREVRDALHLVVPAHLMKVPENGRYKVTLYSGEGSGYDIGMWHLYRDRVRPALLAGNGDQDSGPTYVNYQRAPNTRHIAISTTTVNYDVRRIFDLAGPVLGYGDNRAFDGCRSSHFFRHAVGGKYVNQGQAHVAKDLLHHSRTDTVEKIYSHRGIGITTGAERAAVQGPVGGGDRVEAKRLLERLADRPDLLAEVQRLVERREEDAA